MPICKNCNSRITTFDKDRCPVCGCLDPFLKEASDTVEITSNISLESELKKGVHVKKKSVALILSLLVPFFGTPFYYYHFMKKGLLWFLANLLLIGTLFSLCFFVIFNEEWLFSLIIPLGVTYLFNIALGIYLFNKKDYKDGRGELIR